MKKKFILVTGGAGYIGSATSSLLINYNYNVIILDNLSRGSLENIPKEAIFIKGDIGNENLIKKITKIYDIEAVIHFAGYISVAESMKYPQRYIKNNYIKSKILLKTLFSNGIRKFIFSSSAAVYGSPSEIPVVETSKLKPINPYGKTKLDFEKELFRFSKRGLRYVALRYFNATGSLGSIKEKHNPETHLIPIIINNKKVNIFGDDYETIDGTCIRDYIHIFDLAQAHILALKYLSKKSSNNLDLNDNAFNVGLGRGYSIKEIIKNIENITNKKIKTNILNRRVGDPPILIAKNDKLIKLGWNPKYRNIESILRTII